jgi:hypothetical protein
MHSTSGLTIMLSFQIRASKLSSTTVTTSLDLPLVYLIVVPSEVFLVKDYAAPGLGAHHSVLATLHHAGRQ